MTHSRWVRPKLLTIVLALLAGGMLAAPPAHANPYWELYDTTHARKVAIGDTLAASGKLVFTVNIYANLFRIECRLPAGALSRTLVTGDQLSAAPGNPLTVLLTPDTVFSTSTSGPKQGVCQDITGSSYGFGIDIDVTTTGASVAVDFTMPAGSPGIWLGSLGTSLKLPQNLLTFSDPTLGCSWYGPDLGSGASFSGTYTAGVMTASSGALYAAGGCVPVNAQLESASLTFAPTLSVFY